MKLQDANVMEKEIQEVRESIKSNLGIKNEFDKPKLETEDMVDLGVLNKRQRENSKTNESE